VTFDDSVLQDPDVAEAIKSHTSLTKKYHIKNTDRSCFARVSGYLAKLYGDDGFRGQLNFEITGAAGQSFCAFLSHGIEVALTGFANDYVCKGMAGGKVSIRPPNVEGILPNRGFSVAGNTLLYGATGGKLFVNGRVGERFGVRNSGAVSVVEGVGDHGCEYMTAGAVICLGSTGRNFGAGMTGGLAFVLDDEDWLNGQSECANTLPFTKFLNGETVTAQRLSNSYSSAKSYIVNILREHVTQTGSRRGLQVLQNIDNIIDKIWAVVPNSEKANVLLQKDETVKLSEQISQ